MKQNHKPERSKRSSINRGAAIRASRRAQDDANRTISQFADAAQQSFESSSIKNTNEKIKLTFLGGLEDVGEKNMAVIEYKNEAIILDCGNNLSVDLPGINYAINDTMYLESIKHKIKAYVITHGHLDHMGGLRHTVPKFPAPIYGSRYSIGIIEKAFEDSDFEPELIAVELDTHKKQFLGNFSIEFIRVTHSLPDAAAVCIQTPLGRIIATGDFRLDPEPLDKMPSDVKRLKQLGEEGVLVLLSDSSYADIEGRVPTESTLQQSFYDIIDRAPGRIFVTSFSSNMNRTQMIINAAIAAGRKVVLDGRGMLSYSEIAVRQGILKVPKGTIISSTQASTTKDDRLLIMCTGGQGEPNAALRRMSEGQHKTISLKPGDTVAVSSSPIPGNEIRYDEIGNKLSKIGVKLYRHPTHQLDGCGPLHVSGHARREELREMIQLTKPKFFIPVHGGNLRRTYHAELGIEEGISRSNISLPENGDCIYFTANTIEPGGQVPHGSLLVDQTDAVISSIVVKDRLLLSDQGIVAVVLTIDNKTGQLLSSPDIISRGFIPIRGNEELMNKFRNELKRATTQRFKRVDIDRFKLELRDHIMNFLFEEVGGSPMIIPVVNIVGRTTNVTRLNSPKPYANSNEKPTR